MCRCSLINKICSVFLSLIITVSRAGLNLCCPETSYAVASASCEDTVNELIVLVNEAREEAGVKPLYAVPILNDASLVRALECVETFSHYRPDGSMFNTVLNEYSISYYGAAENIAAGNSTAESTFEQWKNSPNHWKAILNENYTHIGVGFCYQNNTIYGWYWEQLFIACNDEIEGQYLPERYAVVPASCGDLDGDGEISSLDFVLLLKLLKKKVILNDLQVKSADCMFDGALTIADAVVLKKYILGIYDTLPRYP